MLQYSDDYSRTVAKDEFWYLDNDDTTVTGNTATNHGIRARALLSQGDPIKTIKAVIPLNRFSFFEVLEDRLLPQLQLEFKIDLESDENMIFGGCRLGEPSGCGETL